ncbi:hypothetical protein [Ostreibacterium oceani]|uniref:Uncharacterized protein n=1 Tax=Ostreibacterium oceani TaxID=2654998 RepID=A0A6N7EW85_9GAMM|nr:hypothetical protein [Ostreibacterium oceani]MPV86163.1 hypothetical protein [Ostreibacterium oceani]
MATNMRVFSSEGYRNVNAPSLSFAMGMNTSLLESAISEQLFCNEEVNPDNEECYGISTVSGLQRAAAQGQKIYQIDKNNRDQLANVRMSDENMADDINRAINSGGYVIVPEKAVDGVGRDAIYVYMTYNGQTGNQSWKISGGLNGAIFTIISYIFLGISLLALAMSAPVIAFVAGFASLLFGVLAFLEDLPCQIPSLTDLAIGITIGVGVIGLFATSAVAVALFAIGSILLSLFFENIGKAVCNTIEAIRNNRRL